MNFRGISQSGVRLQRFIRLAFLLAAQLLVFNGQAAGDSISGLLDFTYQNSSITTTELGGFPSKNKNDGFQQRYTLAFDKTIYPSLVFDGGGLFEDTMQHGNIDGIKTKSDSTRLSPYLDLKLSNPFISSGLGYRRREDTSSNNGIDAPKLIQDMYTANFGWHPSELPSLDVFYTRRNFYDSKGTVQDVQTDDYTWTSDYRAIKGLEVSYNGNYSTVKDNLAKTLTDSLTNSGRIAYSGSLLNNRVIFHTSYSLAVQNSTITAEGAGGGTFFRPPPTAGSPIFAVTPSGINTVTNGQLAPSAQPVNLVTPLVFPATQNNIGLSFSNNASIETIFLPVVSKPDIANPAVRVPPTVADLTAFAVANPDIFKFTVYTSSDITGTIWGPPLGIVPTVTVGKNPGNPGTDEVGFIINFPLQTTSFIKAVQTPPLTPFIIVIPPGLTTIDPQSIIVVSVQSFRRVTITVQGTSISSSNTGGIFDLNTKAILLDEPNLAYDMSFTFTHNKTDQTDLTTSYLLTNGLGLNHRFSELISTNARVAEEFSSDSQDRIRNAITYNAGVNVTPLPTLNHSLTYGGRVEFFEGQTTLNNSIYLNNSAELYKGLSVNLGAGYSTGTQATGQDSDSITLTVGTEIVPNKNLTLSLSYQDNTSHQSGGGQPSKSSFNRTVSATATYRPFEALYVTGGYSLFMENDKSNVTLRNFGVSWSPFRGGDLQFNFAYSESYDSGANQKDRNISPSLRWNIRPGSTLDVSYNILKSTGGATGNVDSNSFGAHLRIAF